jgi:thiamine biosynthesis lipoprotein
MEQVDFRAMGSDMRGVLDAPWKPAREALIQLPTWFETWEQCMSRFRADSELNQLNAQAGMPVPVSQDLMDVIMASLEAAKATEGLVDPTLKDAMLAIGYDRSFEKLSSGSSDISSGPEHAITNNGAGWWDIRCDPELGLVHLPAGVHLDLGGIGKGWAADRAVERLRVQGPALVDAGGDIAVNEPPHRSQGWPIAVTDPRNPDGEPLAILKIVQGGVATSGRDFRRWTRDGVPQHHILDPQTRQPAETDVLAATVIAPSALEAEAAAKAVLIQGGRRGMAWLESRPQLAGLLVAEDGSMSVSLNLDSHLWS